MEWLSSLLRKKGYILIPLTKLASGHYICTVRLNGVSGLFIVDTGASHSCVAWNKETLFKLTGNATDQQAATASSQEVDTKHSEGNHIQLGSWERQNQDIVLIDLSSVDAALEQFEVAPVDGIIGGDLLHKAKAVLDYRRNGLYLYS
tara:strand:+ start:314 stop:754 length:441 start_codon:yes stop_codon:yes gene_type:complete